MNHKAQFGPAGNSKSFYDAGYKRSSEMPKYLKDIGLDWYEYSCTKGVHIKEDTAKTIGQQSELYNIGLSVHAPYYINLASNDDEKKEKSREYIYQTLEIAKWMNAKRIVFHPGSCKDCNRETSLATAKKQMKIIIEEMKNRGFYDILICPETMGKINQLGSLDEIIELCLTDEKIIPTIDFGHLNSRNNGMLKTQKDYAEILDNVENALGYERMSNMHIHFSHQEYSKSGEVRHLTFEDNEYGPFFEPLSVEITRRNISPVIICESRDTMTEDAVAMKKIYNQDLISQNVVI